MALAAAVGAAPRARGFCFEEAARLYDLPPLLLRTIAEHESRLDPDAAGWNRDGSVDVGLMQINSWWEDRLGRERWIAVCTDPCYNVKVGAWILADCLRRHGYTPEGIGCYNAVSSPKRHAYSKRIVDDLLEKLTRTGPP
ncbi:MAG: lytic transglycosylase domain-containing protein [Deferrisomatales bacterium]